MLDGLGFYIGNFFIAYYGLLIVLGLTAASLIGYLQIKRFEMDFDNFILLAAVGGLFGIIGAKLLYLILIIDQIDLSRLSDGDYFSALMSGGFVFYGGLIGGIIGLLLCNKLFQIDVFAYLQVAVPCLPAAHAFGRIGCRLVGCCYGGSYHGTGAIVYRNSLFAPNNTPLFPVQSAEAFCNIVIVIVLLIYINKYAGKHGFQLYLLYYAVIRFVLEFFRSDVERGVFAGLSTSQYISICFIILLAVHHFLLHKKTSCDT